MTVADEQVADVPPHSDDPDAGFDIGVTRRSERGDRPALPGRSTRSSGAPRRRLPVWAVGGLALLVGWLLGSLIGTGSDATTAQNPLPSAEAPTPVPTVAPSPVAAVPPTSFAAPSRSRLVYAQPSESGRSAPTMSVLRDREARVIVLGDGLADTPPGGRVEPAVVVAGSEVIFVIDREAAIVDVARDQSAQTLTAADHVLPGTGGGNVWAISTATRVVRLVDIGSRSVRATYDLANIGDPIGSFDGGLVVAPDIELFGPFAMWSPARGLERIWALDESARFLDSAASTLVLDTSQGVAAYDTVTGALTQTDHQISRSGPAQAMVSPDGTRLAIVEPHQGDGPAPVRVMALRSGETIDRFETSHPATVRWVSDEQILHTAAGQIRVRETTLGFHASLADVGPTLAWMTLTD